MEPGALLTDQLASGDWTDRLLLLREATLPTIGMVLAAIEGTDDRDLLEALRAIVAHGSVIVGLLSLELGPVRATPLSMALAGLTRLPTRSPGTGRDEAVDILDEVLDGVLHDGLGGLNLTTLEHATDLAGVRFQQTGDPRAVEQTLRLTAVVRGIPMFDHQRLQTRATVLGQQFEQHGDPLDAARATLASREAMEIAFHLDVDTARETAAHHIRHLHLIEQSRSSSPFTERERHEAAGRLVGAENAIAWYRAIVAVPTKARADLLPLLPAPHQDACARASTTGVGLAAFQIPRPPFGCTLEDLLLLLCRASDPACRQAVIEMALVVRLSGPVRLMACGAGFCVPGWETDLDVLAALTVLLAHPDDDSAVEALLGEGRESVRNALAQHSSAVTEASVAARIPEDEGDRLWSTVIATKGRFEREMTLANLEAAIEAGEELLAFLGPTETGGLESTLADWLAMRADHGSPARDLPRALELGAYALDHADDERRAGRLGSQASRLAALYLLTGDGELLDRSIAAGAAALDGIADPGDLRASHLANQAYRHHQRYQRDEHQTDLDTAIALGEASLAATVPTSPWLTQRIGMQGMRLLARGAANGSIKDVRRAISAFEQAAAGVQDARGPVRFLGNLASAHHLAAQLTGDPAHRRAAVEGSRRALVEPLPWHDQSTLLRLFAQVAAHEAVAGEVPELLDEAVAAASDALALIPERHPQRSVAITALAEAILRRRSRGGDSDDDLVLLDLARQWTAAAASPAPVWRGTLRSAQWWVATTFDLVARGAGTWGDVVTAGESAMTAADRLAVLPPRAEVADELRDARVVNVRATISGITGLVALAAVRSGDVPRAVAALERGAVAIATHQASAIPWSKALELSPNEARTALDARRTVEQTLAAAHLHPVEEVKDKIDRFDRSLDALRAALGIELPRTWDPRVETHPERAVAWLAATPVGGLAVLCDDHGKLTATELPGLTTRQVTQWGQRLRPPVEGGAAAEDRSSRGRRRGGDVGAPTPAEAVAVTGEMRQVLDRVGATLAEPGRFLVTAGPLSTLPWQVVWPALRLDIAGRPRPRTAASSGAFVVFADAEGNLGEARDEAVELHIRLGACTHVGPEASLARLASLLDASILHLSVHGTTAPALRLHEADLTVPGVVRLRPLFARLEHLVLNACTSAAPLEGLDDQTVSLGSTALALGTAYALVALWPLEDSAARTFGVAYHRLLADGVEPLDALARARDTTAGRHTDATHLSYQLIG